MTFLIQKNTFWLKPFCDASLVAMLASEQVSVINDLKGGKRETTEGPWRNNGAALGEGTNGAADLPHVNLLKLGLCGPADTILC